MNRAEADEIYHAFALTLGYLGLIYKMDGVVSTLNRSDPFKVPFPDNANEAYEAWTGDIRRRLANLIESDVNE